MPPHTIGDHLPLASEFPPATREAWLKLVDGVLKGRTVETLVSKTYDDLRIESLYSRTASAKLLPGNAVDAPWQIMQRVDHPDPATANKQALQDLENGATGLTLVFAGAVGAYDYGIEASEAALVRALDGIHLDADIALEFDLSPAAKDTAHQLAALLKSRGVDPASVNVRFGLDPLGALAHGGCTPMPWTDTAPIFFALVSDLSTKGFKGPFAVADGRPIHAAGGSEAQELAFALAVAVAYLRGLEAGGIALDAARGMLFFRLAADADQLLTLAKFRAVRKLWARVEEASRLTPRTAFVSAEIAWRMLTKRDPYVNILRATVAAFSAGLGGANAITVLPFTAALGLPDEFARRLARNTQLLLLEEANLGKVADPAAGSGAVENLTQQLCRTAWDLFQQVERTGGVAVALEQGVIQQQVAKVRAAREHNVARRKDVLTGTTEFPHLAEQPARVLHIAPIPLSSPSVSGMHVERLQPVRLAEPFEQLRDASDLLLAGIGSRPKVFLATLGKPADFTVRTTFAKNFFEAGGIEAVTRDDKNAGASLVDAFEASGAVLACLCSSDEMYTAHGPEAARTLASGGARHIYLAGRPKDSEPLKSAGVQTFIYAGCNVLATLQAAHDILASKLEGPRKA